MYPSYHTTRELSRLHQAELLAEADAIRQARLARAASEHAGVSVWERISRLFALVPRPARHPRPLDRRPVFRGADAPRN